MKLFLDTSVLLAAAGSGTGASRAVFSMRDAHHWDLVTSLYCVEETHRNLANVPHRATEEWRDCLHPLLAIVRETLVCDRPLVFTRAKDKPVLLSALAERCDVLLTLDRRDFADVLDACVYGLWVRTPAAFLTHERASGRLTL